MRARFGEDDTICAIATPLGTASIGVIRLSGKDAFSIAASFYSGKGDWASFSTHTIHFGDLVDPTDKTVLDEALFLVMKSPNTYTGEDVVEIQSHGNVFLLQKVISLLLTQGARLATPGEFTRRAYLSGRIDLAQAEAVMEIISARSELHQEWALGQLKGKLSAKISILREQIISIIAHVEASIDFSEEEIPIKDTDEMVLLIRAVLLSIQELLADYENGRKVREGFSVVIVGRPNVGKSSLFNCFLQDERAIVTSIPGTTRDLLREEISLEGLSITLVDTAGYRETNHLIEKEGVLRADKVRQAADLVLWVIDGSVPLQEEDLRLLKLLRTQPKIVIVNKNDLPKQVEIEKIKKENNNAAYIYLSAKTGGGFPVLIHEIKKCLFGASEKEPPQIALLRHRNALEAAEKGLEHALDSFAQKLPREFSAVDLREACDALDEITNGVTSEDLLDRIFNQFCIGK